MNKSTREGFGDQLVISGENNKNILVLNADLKKATSINKFAEAYPERFFDIGIAENNMIGITSGLSENGFKVFSASFAAFLTGKYDTIRCSIAYSNAPCILVGTHSGMAIGKDGVTQMGLEDMSIMRSLPNMMVLAPATYIESMRITEYLCNTDLKNPYYLRLGRQPVKEVFDESYQFKFGKGVVIKEGKDSAIFCIGSVLPDVLEATENMDVDIINMPTLKPIDKEIIEKYLRYSRYKVIFSVEDHSIIGGLGSSMAEVIAESEYSGSCKLIRIGLEDKFPESAPASDLYEKYGLSSNKIKEKIHNILYKDDK
jgi:transketolase